MIAAVVPPGTPQWRILPAGSAEVVIAERDALGTTARLAVWPAGAAPPAAGAVDDELARLDLAASRFRPDSELSHVHALAGQPVTRQRGTGRGRPGGACSRSVDGRPGGSHYRRGPRRPRLRPRLCRRQRA